MSDKSILDGIPVDDKQLTEVLDRQRKQREEVTPKWIPVAEKMGIVGQCPTCGAPIYGHHVIETNRQPEIKYSCKCVDTVVGVIGKMRTT